MAKRNYLVTGLSGVGKSAVFDELIRRGHAAVSTDRVWAHHADPATGLPADSAGHETWIWDAAKAVPVLESAETDVLFVCGDSRNRERFLPWFARVFWLRVDDATMRRRLEARTADDWPLGQDGVELMLRLNHGGDDGPAGAVDIDATRPLAEVVDQILRVTGA